MKKKLISMVALVAMLLGSAGLAACGPAEHDHVWNGGEITTQASCKAEGVKTYVCTVSGCTQTKTEPVSKTPHTWDGGAITSEPSCTEYGVKTFTCTGCETTKTENVDKIAHAYDKGTLTLIPTLTARGETTYKCGVCNDIKKEKVAPRDDFAEHFYTSISNASAWQYGYAENYNAETGEFAFARIAKTSEEYPEIWEAEGVKISAGSIYSQNNAVIAYTVDGETKLNLTVSFTGDEEATRVGAKLSVTNAEGVLKGEATLISADARDWAFSTDEAVEAGAGDFVFIAFFNNGNGAPSGKFGCRVTADCKHVWGEGEETARPSCTQAGVKTYTCSLCGDTKTEGIPAVNHDYSGDWKEVDGGHSRKCTMCGAADESAVTPHNSAEDVSKRIPATCHSDGVKTLVCADCGAETTEAITVRPAHALSGWQETTGGHNKHCENDGCDYVSATETHNMRDGEIIKQPTATEKGEKESVCADCGYTTIIEIPTTDHTAGNEYGKDNEFHWNICGAHTNPACGEQVNKEAHSFVEDVSRRKPATCKEDGKSYWECKCGATKEEVISKDTVEHTMDGGEVTAQPTFWAEGVKTYTCSVCGATETEAVAKLNSTSVDVNNDSWKFGVVDYDFSDNTFEFTQATDNSDGYIINGTQIKNDWFSGANFDTFICVAFTFKEDVDAKIEITFKGIGGDDGILSDYSVRIGIDGVGEWGDRGTEFTVNKTHSFKANDTVYFIFKHETGGWDQGDYSIKINRADNAQN